MFHPIDRENWDRNEIYDFFKDRQYCITVSLDITDFLERIRRRGYKFYPSACWCIAAAANSDSAFRWGVCGGKPGFWDTVNPHYTVRRNHGSGLFSHAVTAFSEDFAEFCPRFLKDKEAAENCGRLYNYDTPQPDGIHISILPEIPFESLSMGGFVKPVDPQSTAYIPFVIMGKYHAEAGRVKLPVCVNFYHAANDGVHAALFFRLLQEKFDGFQAE